jgi:hypothetical protein
LLEYLRNRVAEWLSPNSKGDTSLEGIESLLVDRSEVDESRDAGDSKTNETDVAELLSAGQLGTAIEILEGRIKKQPRDFEALLKLAEAYGVYCCNPDRAGKIVAKIETSPFFSPEQIREAKAKLQKWRLAKT